MVRNILIWLLLALSVLWFLLGAATQWFYYSTLPKNPDDKTDQVHQVVLNHGSVRYGSANQARTLRVMQNSLPVAGLLFAVALLVGLKIGVLQVRGNGPTAKSLANHHGNEGPQPKP